MSEPAKIARRFRHEHGLLQAGLRRIAGVDEAGRGPLAGPVVAAAVVFPQDWILGGLPRKLRPINDSKQLSETEREDLFTELMAHPEIHHAVAEVDVSLIDQINILQSTHRAMNLALARLNPAPEHALVDGLRVKTLAFPQTSLVEGDALSYSIGAASILAKVTRDRLMRELDQQFPQYGFAAHKGYGTPDHLAAIEKHGPCAIHRMSFHPFRPRQTELFADEPLGKM